MPYIAQCPSEDCLKFMLLENHERGLVLNCLCCKKPVWLPPLVDDDEVVCDADIVASRPRFIVKRFPKCQTPLRIDPGNLLQAVQCIECDFWGLIP